MKPKEYNNNLKKHFKKFISSLTYKQKEKKYIFLNLQLKNMRTTIIYIEPNFNFLIFFIGLMLFSIDYPKRGRKSLVFVTLSINVRCSCLTFLFDFFSIP